MKLLIILLFLVPYLGLFLTSCIIPVSNHRIPNFYLLNSVGTDRNKTDSFDEISFYVNEVRLAQYLQDNRMVDRPNDEVIEFRENERWGEPLEVGISRVVGQNLSAIIGTLNYGVFPHRKKFDLNHEIELTVDRFEKVSNHTIQVQAFWEIKHKDGRFQRNVFERNFKIKGLGNRDEIRALSEALFAISKEMGEAIIQFD
tara:strand:- start:435 stop:1034 length:600 start_codon:yes stop_codon:yes gene_type:complete